MPSFFSKIKEELLSVSLLRAKKGIDSNLALLIGYRTMKWSQQKQNLIGLL